MGNVEEKVIAIIGRMTGLKEVQSNLDIDLFEDGLLDSLGLVEFIVAVEQELGIKLSPSQLNRLAWATPRKIINYLETRLV